jgi:hypothetical protein
MQCAVSIRTWLASGAKGVDGRENAAWPTSWGRLRNKRKEEADPPRTNLLAPPPIIQHKGTQALSGQISKPARVNDEDLSGTF